MAAPKVPSSSAKLFSKKRPKKLIVESDEELESGVEKTVQNVTMPNSEVAAIVPVQAAASPLPAATGLNPIRRRG